jgi:hypothetical protein
MEKPQELLEKIRRWREGVFSIVFAALLLGFAIEALANFVFTGRWFWAALVFVVLVLATVFAILWLYTWRSAEEETIDCIIPIYIGPQSTPRVEVPILEPYRASWVLHQALHRSLKLEAGGGEVLGSRWHDVRERNPLEIGTAMRLHVHNLVWYLIVKNLQRYGREALGRDALHGRWSYVAKRNKVSKVPWPQLPQRLQALYGLFDPAEPKQQVLQLPVGVRLLDVGGDENGVGSRVLLKSALGAMSIFVPIHWSSISARSRDGKALSRMAVERGAQRYMAAAFRSSGWGTVYVPRIPVRVSVRFNALRAFGGRFEGFYLWAISLIQFLRLEMDWNLVMDGETERLVVDLVERTRYLPRPLP